MLARGLENQPSADTGPIGEQPRPATGNGDGPHATVVPAAARFARDAAEFATGRTADAGEQTRRPS
jgi:hypothetical protein